MPRQSSQAPPALATRLLAGLLGNGGFASSVAGDLSEEWAARVARAARFNTAWYWRECVRIGVHITLARYKGAPIRDVLMAGRHDSTTSARAIRGDLSRGLRNAARQPLLVGLASAAIALGVASPTTIFSIVHGLSRDLPFNEGNRIVYVTQTNRATGERDLGLTEPVFAALSHDQHSLEGIAAYTTAPVSLVYGAGPAERYSAARISPSAFSLLRVKPAVGTVFTDEDARSGTDVAMISDQLWHDRFSGAPGIVGQTVRLNGHPTRIAAIMPAGFLFPLKEHVWLPLALRPGTVGALPVKAFGRLHRGVTAAAADAEFATIGARAVRDLSVPDMPVVTRVLPFKESQIEPSDVFLFRAMILVVSTVLLVACANVANLLLAHVAARGPLFAVKAALGASRGAIVREMLAESACISVLGGAGGLVLAGAAVRWFNDSVSDALPSFWMRITIDGGVLAFCTVLVAVATFAAGLVPALYASKADPAAALRVRGGMSSRKSARTMRALLTMEIALSCALLVVAGLMTKGAVRGSRPGLRVDPSRIVSAQVDLGVLGGDSAFASFAAQAIARSATDSRLESFAFTTVLPGSAGAPTKIALEGQVYARAADLPRTRLAIVSSHYFDVLGVHAASGRLLDESDVLLHPRVAVVNDAFIRAHLAAQPPIGARVRIHDGGDTSWVTIVGTVPDLVTMSADPTTVELLIAPFAQRPASAASVLATGPGGTQLVAAAIRDLVRATAQDVPVTHVERLTDEIARSRRASWSLAYVFAECGLAGLLLTALGVYGVADTTSRRRVRELTIRRALGLGRRQAVGLIVGEAAPPLIIGLALGSGAALIVGPALTGLLFGVSAHDPMVFGTVTAVLSAVMLFAAARPAIWAARAPLADALRG